MASLAFNYRAWEQPNYVIQPELKLSYVDSQVNAFSETNINTMQALSVARQNSQSLVTEAAVGAKFLMTPAFSLNGRLGVSNTSGEVSRAVTANVVGETSTFGVRAPGMGSTALNIGMGATFLPTDKLTLSASYRGAVAKDAKTSNSLSVNAVLSF
jgi:outer membrane autotransporter protein